MNIDQQEFNARIIKYREEHLHKQERMFQNLLVVTTTVLSLTVSLHGSVHTGQPKRILYLTALFLMLASCILNAIQLFGATDFPLRSAHAYELIRDQSKYHRYLYNRYIPVPRWISIFQKLSLSSFLLSLVLLTLYSVL